MLLFLTLLSMMLTLISTAYQMTTFINFTIWHFSIPVSMDMMMNWQNMMFASTVLMISAMMFTFSKAYIPKEKLKFFYIMMSLFISSMMLLVMSNNIMFLIIGWDGLGLTSYILVMFYQTHSSSSAASMTILTNRIGDIMIILSISLMINSGLWNMTQKSTPIVIMLLLLTASMTKSAQFPFTAWLPAAMAAPTPVSALVHSSTLVTAGVFLLFRLSNQIHPTTLNILMITAITTSITASASALMETDLKKIIALSTLSQIAFMMVALALKLPSLTLFHLITHALFKATMFMCVGYIIHTSNYQDKRSIKPSEQQSTVINTSLGITSMALSGLPFTTAFYSKDPMLEFTCQTNYNITISTLLFISTSLTTAYNIRIATNFISTIPSKSPDNSNPLSTPMINSILTLTPLSTMMGSSLSWLIFPNHNPTITNLEKLSPLLMMIMGLSCFMMPKPHKKMTVPSSMWTMNFTSSTPFMKIMHMKFIHMDNTWSEMPLTSMYTSLNYFKKTLSLPSILMMMMMIPLLTYPLSLLTKAIYWK